MTSQNGTSAKLRIREKALGKHLLKSEVIEVPEWEAQVEIRELSAAARDDWRQKAHIGEKDSNPLTAQIELIIGNTYEPGTGMKVFERTDRDGLMEMPAGLIDRVSMAILRLSGLTADAVEAAEKNSVATQNDGSTSS